MFNSKITNRLLLVIANLLLISVYVQVNDYIKKYGGTNLGKRGLNSLKIWSGKLVELSKEIE